VLWEHEVAGSNPAAPTRILEVLIASRLGEHVVRMLPLKMLQEIGLSIERLITDVTHGRFGIA
jgi:hypothetical protein